MNDDVERPDSPQTRLVVEPTRVGGRRSTLPGIAVAAIAVAFLGVAVWKPWDGRSDARSAPIASASPVIADGTDGSPGPGDPPLPSGAGSTPIAVAIPHFPSDPTMVAAAAVRLDWGLRAIVIRDGPPGFPGEPHVAERWFPAAGLAGGDAQPTPSSAPLVDAHDDVAALGVTSSADDLALDVRFWHLSDDEPPRRLAAIAVAGPEAGSWLWRADPSFRSAAGTWPGGTYVVEALTARRIIRQMIVIGRDEAVALPIGGPGFEPPADRMVQRLPVGPFAVILGSAQHLLGGDTLHVDERGAWLGVGAGGAEVARIEALDTSAIGAITGDGLEPTDLTIREIAPEPRPIALAVDLLSVAPADWRAILGRPAELGLFPTGLYAVTMTATDQAGAVASTTWTVEIGPPSEVSPPDSPLEAVRRWSGTIDDPAAAAGQPILVLDGETRAGCGSGPMISTADRLLGIVAPAGQSIERVSVRPVGGPSAALPIAYAAEVVPRLTVVALPPTGLPIGTVRLSLALAGSGGRTSRPIDICVGPG